MVVEAWFGGIFFFEGKRGGGLEIEKMLLCKKQIYYKRKGGGGVGFLYLLRGLVWARGRDGRGSRDFGFRKVVMRPSCGRERVRQKIL